jgi:hypothetical protein
MRGENGGFGEVGRKKKGSGKRVSGKSVDVSMKICLLTC